jgi:hypothetical protein
MLLAIVIEHVIPALKRLRVVAVPYLDAILAAAPVIRSGG